MNTETPSDLSPLMVARTGRKTKRTPFVERKICRAIADGLPFGLAAAHGGIKGVTLNMWRRKFPQFNEAIEQAIASGINRRLKQIRRAGDEGDWKASAWWLEHVVPEHYAKSRIELAHIGQVEHTFTIPLKILDEIAAVRKQQEEKHIDLDRA